MRYEAKYQGLFNLKVVIDLMDVLIAPGGSQAGKFGFVTMSQMSLPFS